MAAEGAMMARTRRHGDAEEAQRNAELIEEIERIAHETNYRHRDARGKLVANRSALAEACGLTRGGFDAIYSGGLGRPPTLRALAHFAQRAGVSGYTGAHPYRRLYRIVGWEDPDAQDGADGALDLTPPQETVVRYLHPRPLEEQAALARMLEAMGEAIDEATRAQMRQVQDQPEEVQQGLEQMFCTPDAPGLPREAEG